MITLAVERVRGVATLQDRGRPGHMHHGVPPGGPLDPVAFEEAVARAAATVPDTGTAIELVGSLRLVARASCVVVADGEPPRELAAGEAYDVASRGPGARVRYVAVRGGFDVPIVLGGRGTLLVAALGGLHGRALREGDELRVGATSSEPQTENVHSTHVDPRRGEAVVPVVAGPDLACFAADALAQLFASTWTAASFDRTGARLAGPALPRRGPDPSRSAPMVRGAVQVPPDGAPIVLGPDHPTTGGYPVVAVVASSAFGRIEQVAPGGRVQFVPVDRA